MTGPLTTDLDDQLSSFTARRVGVRSASGAGCAASTDVGESEGSCVEAWGAASATRADTLRAIRHRWRLAFMCRFLFEVAVRALRLRWSDRAQRREFGIVTNGMSARGAGTR